MNRRTFIQTITAVVSGLCSLPFIGSPEEKSLSAPLTNAQRKTIIDEALKTDAGRKALAKAMIEPIRKSLNYQEVGKKLLMTDNKSSFAVSMIRKGIL